jgi:hypothetical protein
MKLLYKTLFSWFLLLYCISCIGKHGQGENKSVNLKPFPLVVTGNTVIVPPKGVHPFYKKYINADGIIIVSSDKVPDAALIAARKTVLYVLSKRPDVHRAMLRYDPRISIMAISEKASDLPDFGPRDDGQWGLGQRPGDPTALVSEKGICYEGNREYIANFLLHEFVHMMHNLAIKTNDPGVSAEIYAAYLNAVKKGFFIPPKNEVLEGIAPFRGYGVDEYFTHSVNAWYNLNESLPGIWMDVKIGEWGPRSGTKKELKQRDPAIYEIISRYFPESGGDLIKPCNPVKKH